MVAVVAALDGTPVFRDGTGTATPTSTSKLLTAAAALETLGPDHLRDHGRPGPRRVVLVGGGDPARPSGLKLAALTAAGLSATKGPTKRPVSVGYDTSLFTGPT